MSKSAIYVANPNIQDVVVDGLINLGSVYRRFGCNVNLATANSIRLDGAGYYDIDASFTVAPTAIGDATITLFKNGVAIPGATATESATVANVPVNLSINCLIREFCPCTGDTSDITFVLTGTDSEIQNVAVVAEKL
jgi:hypothetical protein